MKTAKSTHRKPIAHLYCRVSHPDQRRGGGIERQTAADVESFCQRFEFSLSKTVLVDDGVSAWKGLNATPDHELGKFLADARRGAIPPGDCLIVENYDRLSRQSPWAAIGLVNSLRELGIHVGRLDKGKLLRCDSEDVGDFFEAAIEFMRGNSESSIKSVRHTDEWKKKRAAARTAQKVITRRLPAWIREVDGQLELIPDRAAVMKEIFRLGALGYGASAIVKKFTSEGIAPWAVQNVRARKGETKPGTSSIGGKHWSRAYLMELLRDRRVLGEFQPRDKDKEPSGPPIPDYFPAAISEDEWLAVQAVRGSKRQPSGQKGLRVELFSGLIKDARDGSGYQVATRVHKGKTYRILLNTGGFEGRTRACSFPLPAFETAILSKLEELDPHEILNGDSGPDETLLLAGRLAELDGEIAALKARLKVKYSDAVASVLESQEDDAKALAAQLAAAREKAAHPLSETWGETQTLLGALRTTADPFTLRTRLRAALRRIIDSIWLLVVPRGRDRLAAVQIWFAGSKRQRSYLVLSRALLDNGRVRKEGGLWVTSFADVALPGALDLRDRQAAREVAAALEVIEVQALAKRMGG